MSTRFYLLKLKSRLNQQKYHLKQKNCKFLFAYFPFHFFFFKVHLLLLLYPLQSKSLPRTTKVWTDRQTDRHPIPFYILGLVGRVAAQARNNSCVVTIMLGSFQFQQGHNSNERNPFKYGPRANQGQLIYLQST